MDPSNGTTLGGKYRLERPLASGGMGSIWVARHTELDTPVAVKLIGWLRALQPPIVERFRREARLAAQIRSINIVQVLDYGVESGVPYMVMELLDGEDLEHLMERSGKLTLQRTLEIVRPVAKALAMVHDAGLVHRDVKPANIFLSNIGGDEIVKLVDFGIAREERPADGQRLTRTSQFVGSPLYMSPEQFRAEPTTRRSDLWSLAMVLFEMLAGEPPLWADSLATLQEAILRAPFPKLSDKRPELEALDRFFEVAFSRDPERRHRDALIFLNAFEEGAALVDTKIATSRLSGTMAPAAAGKSTAFDDTMGISAATTLPGSVDAPPSADALKGTLDPSTTSRGRRNAATRRSRWLLLAGGVAAAGLAVLGYFAVPRGAGGSHGEGASAPGAVADSAGTSTGHVGVDIVPSVSLPGDNPTLGLVASASANASVSDPVASVSATATSSTVTSGKIPRSPLSSTAKTTAKTTPTVTTPPSSTTKVDPRWGVPVSQPR